MTALELFTLEEVAAKLRLERKALAKWLNKNPLSRDGRPHYLKLGQSKRFDVHQLTMIYYALRDVGILEHQIDIWDQPPARIGPPDHNGVIYFIDNGTHIKIGYSRSLDDRLNKMVTDSAVELNVLHIEPGTFKREKVYHRHFAELRERGEWFRKTPELLEFIKQRKRITAGET